MRMKMMDVNVMITERVVAISAKYGILSSVLLIRIKDIRDNMAKLIDKIKRQLNTNPIIFFSWNKFPEIRLL